MVSPNVQAHASRVKLDSCDRRVATRWSGARSRRRSAEVSKADSMACRGLAHTAAVDEIEPMDGASGVLEGGGPSEGGRRLGWWLWIGESSHARAPVPRAAGGTAIVALGPVEIGDEETRDNCAFYPFTSLQIYIYIYIWVILLPQSRCCPRGVQRALQAGLVPAGGRGRWGGLSRRRGAQMIPNSAPRPMAATAALSAAFDPNNVTRASSPTPGRSCARRAIPGPSAGSEAHRGLRCASSTGNWPVPASDGVSQSHISLLASHSTDTCESMASVSCSSMCV